MNIKLTKNIEEATLITHAGKFHPDDVFSTVLLSKIVDNPVVCRTTNQDVKSDNAIIYDIGFGAFDHHGPNAKYRQESPIKYCSFGLLWQEYGHKYLKDIPSNNQDLLFKKIDENLIKQIDAIDNGLFPEINAPYPLSDLDMIIDLFNSNWNEEKDNDESFLSALEIAEKIFDRFIMKQNALITAISKVEEGINKVKDNILILNEYMPYEEALFASKNPLANTVKIIIMPSNRGGYNIKPRTISLESKELLINFPQEYRGLHDKELKNVSHIETARFVHLSGFLACADDLEGALKLAYTALNNQE